MADLIISQPMTFTVDVKNGLVERPQRDSLMRGDKMANRIIAELVYGSEPFDITGVTVKGKFCRPPNGDEIDLAGEAKGNVAEVQLTDQCYTSGGHYEARVILVLGGVERTVLFISGDVLKSGSGNAAGDEETGGSGGSTGSGLPAGGTAGQVLVKVSSAQGDAIWKNLTAADVGARPDNWMPTAADVGALPSDGTAVNANALNGKSADQYMLKTDTAADSAKLDGKDAKYYIQPRNLLDNSDFTNPVNQREQTSYSSSGAYCIDRWMMWQIVADGTYGTFTVNSGYISLSGNLKCEQRILSKCVKPNAIYTAAAKKTDGEIILVSGRLETGATNDEGIYIKMSSDSSSGVVGIMPGDYLWVVLYEGEYTAENLPPYVPKGYSVELAECLRYYYKFDTSTNGMYLPCIGGIAQIPGFLFGNEMRLVPTMTINSLKTWTTSAGFADISGNISSQKCTTGGLQYIEMKTSFSGDGLIMMNADFSADL